MYDMCARCGLLAEVTEGRTTSLHCKAKHKHILKKGGVPFAHTRSAKTTWHPRRTTLSLGCTRREAASRPPPHLIARVQRHLRQQLAIASPSGALAPHVFESPRPCREKGHHSSLAGGPLDYPPPVLARQKLRRETHCPPQLICGKNKQVKEIYS